MEEPEMVNLIMETLKNNPYTFFEYLKMYKENNGKEERLPNINDKDINFLHSKKYYNSLAFKIYICELVYNAINLFPDISEYTIKCQNENGINYLTLGLFKINNYPYMGKFKASFYDEWVYLRLQDIKAFYISNRFPGGIHAGANAVIVSMFMGESFPKITTSYKINPDYLKKTLKFK